MLTRWLNRSEPIGCHIGAGRVRLAQVRGLASGRPRAVVAERALPDLSEADPGYGPAVAALLREMRRSAPFQGSRVVSCLPAGGARYTTMRLAPMPPAELAKAAHWKLSAELSAGPDTFKSAVLNVATIREGAKQKTEALVLSATVERLDRHVAMLDRAGLHHVAIDDPVCAMARCLGTAELAGGASPGHRVVLNLRDEEAFLAVTAGSDLAFVRPLELGLSHLVKTLADLLEVTPAEAGALHARALAHPPAGGDSGDDAAPPANWYSAVPFARARDAIADASRMYGRELARQVALSMYYYATASTAAAPDTGVVVSDRTIDPAALEAVTVQSGIDLSAFGPAGDADHFWGPLKTSTGSPDVGPWVTAVGLSLYEHGLPVAKEVA